MEQMEAKPEEYRDIIKLVEVHARRSVCYGQAWAVNLTSSRRIGSLAALHKLEEICILRRRIIPKVRSVSVLCKTCDNSGDLSVQY